MAKDYANSEVVGYNPTPGPKNPGKYPFVGPSYNYYGEQQGYIYDPYSDNYVPDPKVQNQYYEENGLKEDEPGYMDALLPIAGAGVSYGLAQGFANNPSGFVSGIGEMIPSWGASAPAATSAAPAATSAGTTAAANTGLISSGSSAASGAAGATATESALGIGSAGATTAASSAGGAATFSSAAAAEAAGYTAVGTAAEGGVIAVPASGSGAAGMAAYAGPAALAALAAATAYQSYQNYGAAKDAAGDGAMTDDEVYSISDPWREPLQNIGGESAPGFLKEAHNFAFDRHPLSLILNSVLGSGKHKDQLYRERMWNGLKKSGVVSDENTWATADGNSWDFGIDGRHELQNVGSNIDGKNSRHYYDVDFSDSNAASVVADLDPIGAIMGGGNQKLTEQATGKWVNAVTSSGDPKANTLKVYTDLGFDRNSAWQTIDEMVKAKKLDQAKGDAYKNSIDRVFGAGEYAPGGSQYGIAPAPPAPAMPTPPGSQAPSPTPPAPRDSGMGNGMDPRTTAMQPRGPQSTGLIPSQTPPPSNVNQVLRPRNNGTVLGAPRTGSSANQFMTTPGSGNTGLMPRDNNAQPQAQAPRPGFGIRVSPGVYKDPKTGKTYLSKDGAL